MRRLAVLLMGLLIITSVSGLAAQQQDLSAAPLQVIDTNPYSGEELGLQEDISLFFDRPLDCTTAQSAVSISPAVDGTVSCDGSSLRFSPSAAYDNASSYTISVGSALTAVDGATLADAYQLTLNTVGNLAVSDVLPAAGSTGIETQSVITVIFNRPVVPLVSNEDRGTLPNPLTIDPAVDGTGEWLNTSIYVFHPDPALAGGTDYTVTVKAGLTAVDGATLPLADSWSFRTLDPAIVEVTPKDQVSDVGLNDPIKITFNQAMDQASVESSFYLRPAGDTAGAGTVAVVFYWSDDSTVFTVTPAHNLALDTLYDAGFAPAQALAINGQASLTGFTNWSFNTVPAPGIVGTDPFDGQTDVPLYNSFSIYFAGPMDRATLDGKITIDPAPSRDPDTYYYDYDDSYNLSFPEEPSTTYTITIAPGMADVYGNTIERGRTITYTTAPYDPDVQLRAPYGVGLYNAYNDQTQVYVTHRNVSKLDLSLYSVPQQDFVSALSDNSYDPSQNFQPTSSDFLSQWEINSNTPENQLRFELLNLGQAASDTISCPGAPASRLRVGDSAIVITDPDPVRARSAPVDGDVVATLYRDYRVSIIGGPECADSIVWWQVSLRDNQTGWVAEGADGEYYFDLLSPGASTPVDLPASGSEALAPGIYMLEITAPETSKLGYAPVKHFVMVATAQLTLKTSNGEIVAWATDLESGEPIPNASISFYDRDHGQIGSAVTDADGLARISLPDDPNSDPYQAEVAILNNGTQFGLGASSWTSGIDAYTFGYYNDYGGHYRTYLYTDRPVYRPDQPVYFKGVVRHRDDVTYTPPTAFDTVPVQIIDENGDVVYDKSLPLNAYGTFNGEFDIAADAPLGNYRLHAELPGSSNYVYEGADLNFSVAEYRTPEFQVDVTADKDQVVQNDTIHVLVDSQFFFGGAVSNANVDYSVSTQAFNFNYQGPGYYDFNDVNYDSGPGESLNFYGEEIASGSGTTNDQGQYMIDIPADLKDATQSQTWTIEATVRDESGMTVSGRTEVTVHKGNVYVGARPTAYVGNAGEENQVEIITVDWDSQPVPNQTVDVEVVERHWSNVQEQDESGRTTWTWQVEEVPVTTGTVTTDAQGKASYNFTPPNGGIFKVTVKTRDSAGNEVIAATTMWVASGEYVSWRQQNSNRIDLIADQNSYEIGDTAEILITSPFQGKVEALISVERGKVLHTERVTMDSNSLLYHLPITDDFAPNVFVTAMIVKGVDENNPVAGFRMGMVELGVDNQRKQINITATPDKEQAGPRETVTYTIETTDWKGDPVQAEVGVGLTDLASLSVGQPNSGPILDYYYGEQGLGVFTATPLTINTDQYTQTVLDTIKGGGGGGGEGGIFDIRENFVDTAYWNATLTTDANGQAQIAVTLPDNLTTWRLDVRAVTSGDRWPDAGGSEHLRPAQHQAAADPPGDAALRGGR